MPENRTDELYRALQEKGYPDEFLQRNCVQADEHRLYSDTYALVICIVFQIRVRRM